MPLSISDAAQQVRNGLTHANPWRQPDQAAELPLSTSTRSSGTRQTRRPAPIARFDLDESNLSYLPRRNLTKSEKLACGLAMGAAFVGGMIPGGFIGAHVTTTQPASPFGPIQPAIAVTRYVTLVPTATITSTITQTAAPYTETRFSDGPVTVPGTTDSQTTRAATTVFTETATVIAHPAQTQTLTMTHTEFGPLADPLLPLIGHPAGWTGGDGLS